MQGLNAMSNSWLQLSKRMTAVLALTLFCWSSVLAASHSLHEKSHGHDAAAPEHQCAAKLLAQGHVESFCPVVAFAAPATSVFFSLPAPAPVFVSADRRLSPGRGPPVSPA